MRLKNILNGDGNSANDSVLSIVHRKIWISFFLGEEDIFNKLLNQNREKVTSTKLAGIEMILINPSLGVLKAFQILFNNSMIF